VHRLNFKALVLVACLFLLQLFATRAKADHDNEEPVRSLRVAIFHAPPIMEVNPDGSYSGFMVELLDELAKLEHWELEWVRLYWPEVIPAALNNQIDLIPFISYSEERAEYLDYNDIGILTGWGQVFVHGSEETPKNILGLSGKTIAIIKNEIYGEKLAGLCELFIIECNFIEVSTYEEAFELLQSRKVSAFVTSNLVSYSYSNNFVKKTPIAFEPRKVLFATAKNTNASLLKTIDHYTKLWRYDKESPYFALKQKYLSEIEQNQPIPPWVIYVLLAVLGLLLMLALISLLLRQQVKIKTQHIEEQSDKIRQIINLVPHMIFATNANGKLILANRYASKFFGIDRSNKKHHDKKDILEKAQKASNLFDDEELLLRRDAHALQKEIETFNVDNEKFVLNISKVPFITRYSRTPSVVTVGVDITESKAYENQIKHMAQHDLLTGLPNKLLLNDRLEQSLVLTKSYGHSGAVLFIDLDYFKNINDSLGHAIGDELLKEVARRIKSQVREGDTVARHSGDEFIVHLNHLSGHPSKAESFAKNIAEAINFAIAQEYEFEGNKLFTTASIGIVIYPSSAKTVESIIKRAETAMYYAESMGRNRYAVFTRAMEKAVVRRQVLESELRKALQESRFILRFQPQIADDDYKCIGAEALLRWSHPTEGIVSPTEFIPIAEQNHLIIPIGEWVLKQVCHQIKYWLETYGYSPFITVNLSAVQIRNSDLVHYIEKLLEQTQIPPHLLELEITETVLLHEGRASIEVLNQLRNLGLKLSIDDFGTGYSSLNYLKRLPLDKLKIDRSFVKDIPGDPDSETIINTIINMSHDMGLEVIAEGVETKEQLNYLLAEQCCLFQGFYFDPPLSLKQFETKYFDNLHHSVLFDNKVVSLKEYSKKAKKH
jgi:polar amino acid transport system substrate-binding protein